MIHLFHQESDPSCNREQIIICPYITLFSMYKIYSYNILLLPNKRPPPFVPDSKISLHSQPPPTYAALRASHLQGDDARAKGFRKNILISLNCNGLC